MATMTELINRMLDHYDWTGKDRDEFIGEWATIFEENEV